nr:hypothetical protein [Planctomycetales bacterium]
MIEKSAVAIEIGPYHDPSAQREHNRRHWNRYATQPEDVVLTVADRKQHAV